MRSPRQPGLFRDRARAMKDLLTAVDAQQSSIADCARLLLASWHGGFWAAIFALALQQLLVAWHNLIADAQTLLHHLGLHFRDEFGECWLCEPELTDEERFERLRLPEKGDPS